MTISAATIATLYDVLVELQADAFTANTAVDHRKCITYLRQATSRIEAELAEISFLPENQTRYFSAHNQEDGGDVDVYDLILDTPLLSLTSVTNGDAATLTSDQYTLIPREGAPYSRIRLKANSGVYWSEDTTTSEYRDAISVTGVWSGSNRPLRGGAWYDSGDTVRDAPLLSTATTVTVAASDSIDALYGVPRFSPGMRCRTASGGNTDYWDILWRDENNTTLRVQRAAGGTTAAQHAQGTTIEVWRPDENIVRACARLAAFYYRRAGRFANAEMTQDGTVNKYDALPKDIAEILALYKTTAKAGPRFMMLKA